MKLIDKYDDTELLFLYRYAFIEKFHVTSDYVSTSELKYEMRYNYIISTCNMVYDESNNTKWNALFDSLIKLDLAELKIDAMTRQIKFRTGAQINDFKRHLKSLRKEQAHISKQARTSSGLRKA